MPVAAARGATVVYAFHAMHPIVLNSIKHRFRGLYARHFCKIASVEVGRRESSSTTTELSEVVTNFKHRVRTFDDFLRLYIIMQAHLSIL